MSLTKKSFGLIAGIMLVLLAFSFIFFASPVSAAPVPAQEMLDSWLTVEVNATGTEATITSFGYMPDGTSPSEITIPAATNGVPITAIANDVFTQAGLTNVVFEGTNLKSIGAYAFSSNPFTSIDLPNSVVTLGDYAFTNCTKLTSIDLSNLYITTLPTGVFRGCVALSQVDFPVRKNLKYIGSVAFGECPLEEAVIPSTVEAIGWDGVVPENAVDESYKWGVFSFRGTKILNLQAFEPGEIDLFVATGEGGAYSTAKVIWGTTHSNMSDTSTCFLINTDTGKLVGLKENYQNYPDWNNGNLVIPATISDTHVTSIAPSFLRDQRIRLTNKTVKIEANITEIPFAAFREVQMKEIILPNSVTRIEANAFRHNAFTSIELPENLRYVGALAFAQNQLNPLTSVVFKGSAIEEIGADAFYQYNYKNLTDIYLEKIKKDNIENAPWGAIGATIHWKNNEKSLPQVVTDSTGDWDFMPETGVIAAYNGSDTEIEVPSVLRYGNERTLIKQVGSAESCIFPLDVKKITFPDGIEAIGPTICYNTSLEEVIFSDSIRSIGSNSFRGCQLKKIDLPKSLEYIGYYAFRDNPIKGDVVIPGNMKNINVNVFIGCSGITSFHLDFYKNQDGDGVYDPNNELYHNINDPYIYTLYVDGNDPARVGEALNRVVVNNLLDGLDADALAGNIYYKDSPQPVPASAETLNPDFSVAGNSLMVTIPVTTNHTALKVKDFAGDNIVGNTFVNSDHMNNPATVTIKADAPGVYNYTIKYGIYNDDTDVREYPASIDLTKYFHKLMYNMRSGSYQEQATYEAGYYVTGARNVRALAPAAEDVTAPLGYELTGWNTKSNGTGTAYAFGDTITIGESDIVLYAQYKQEVSANQKAADEVIEMINNIGVVTPDKADEIAAIRDAYNKLTPAQKALVDNIGTLDAAEATLEELANDPAKAAQAEIDNVEDLVSKIIRPVTLDQKGLIEEAIAAYDALTPEQQAKVKSSTKTKLNQVKASLEDLEAAQAVQDALDAIGIVTTDKEAAIQAVRDAYNDLTIGQKALLGDDFLESLVAVENELAELKADPEKAKQAEIENVLDLIGQITEPIDKDDEDAIKAAKEAYEALDEDQKAKVDPNFVDKLNNAEETLGEIKTNEVNDVKQAINDLPGADDVGIDNADAIRAAREAYEALDEEQKAAIDAETLAKLEAAEDVLDVIEVVEGIENLPAAGEITANDKDAIEAARAAYEALTDEQKAKVPAEKLAELEAAEAALADVEAAKAVSDAVADLPAAADVTVDDKAAIEAAVDAYNNLTDAQKARLSQEEKDKIAALAGKLADIEVAEPVVEDIESLPTADKVKASQAAWVNEVAAAYDALTEDQKALVPQEAKDKLAAVKAKIDELTKDEDVRDVEAAINNLPAANDVTLADEADILAAKAAYDALTDAQKAAVDPDAKAALDAAVDAIDTLKADAVKDQIEALPAVDALTLDDEAAVVAAREAYDALTDAQKAKVGAEAKAALEAAEAKIAELKGGSDDIDVSKIDNKKTGATITANGNVLTVACNQACVVAYTTNGTDYTKVAAVKNGNAYNFTIPAGVASENIAIVKKGDVTMDGRVDGGDAALIDSYDVGAENLTSLELLVAEVNGFGSVDAGDAALIDAVDVGAETLDW